MTNMMHPILEETIVRKIESSRLSSLRDTLLPRLMSGELKINDISV
jgi:type I restriction enzyme S subunit